MSDIGLRPSINYAKHEADILENINNVKMATVMCGTVKVNYKVIGWWQQGLISD